MNCEMKKPLKNNHPADKGNWHFTEAQLGIGKTSDAFNEMFPPFHDWSKALESAGIESEELAFSE